MKGHEEEVAEDRLPSPAVQVISSGNGIKRHPLFFLEFMWRKKVRQIEAGRDLSGWKSDWGEELFTGRPPLSWPCQGHKLFSRHDSNPAQDHTVDPHSYASIDRAAMVVKPEGELADVNAERDRVNALTDFTNTPIVVREIQKIYPGLDGGKPKVGQKSSPLGRPGALCCGSDGEDGPADEALMGQRAPLKLRSPLRSRAHTTWHPHSLAVPPSRWLSRA